MRCFPSFVLPIVLVAACDIADPTTSTPSPPKIFSPTFQLSPQLTSAVSGYVAIDLGERTREAVAINSAGQIVGTFRAASGLHGFLWDRGVLMDLGTLGGAISTALAINDAGQIVGFSSTSSGGLRAFLWADGAMTDLGTLAGNHSSAEGINSRGQIIGQDLEGGIFWDNGVMTRLPFHPRAINDSGEVVGTGAYHWDEGVATLIRGGTAHDINNVGQIVGLNGGGWLWEDGVTTNLGFNPIGINESGQVAGNCGASPHACLWDNGVVTDLGSLGGGVAFVRAIGETGQVIGISCLEPADPEGSDDCTPFPRAFVWANGVMADLGTLGGTHSEAFAINRAGEIVGESQITPNDFAAHATLWRPMGPRQRTQALQDGVQELVSSGTLAQEEADGLLAKLRQALAELDAGRNDVAVKQLDAFIRHVEGFVNDGVLSPELGDALVKAGRAVIRQLQAAIS